MPKVFATSHEWALQGLSLDGICIPQKRISDSESVLTCLDMLSSPGKYLVRFTTALVLREDSSGD